jgi:hypothetical protein
VADAQLQIKIWRVDYNTVRPHSALDDQTPHQFAESKEGARRLPPARLKEDSKPPPTHCPSGTKSQGPSKSAELSV